MSSKKFPSALVVVFFGEQGPFFVWGQLLGGGFGCFRGSCSEASGGVKRRLEVSRGVFKRLQASGGVWIPQKASARLLKAQSPAEKQGGLGH